MVLPTDDDIIMTLDECGYRWVAWQRTLTRMGTEPDEFLAALDLELAADSWRERFLALVARRGWILDEGAARDAGRFGCYVVATAV